VIRIRPAAAAALAAAVLAACGPPTRAEGRRRRLDTFRTALPDSVRLVFDEIGSPEDCGAAARMLTAARDADPALDAVMDSIMHAELVDCFSDSDLVYFFWYYFADAIEKGRIPEP
jgi:hypothetical protein